MENVLANHLGAAVRDVFETMLFMGIDEARNTDGETEILRFDCSAFVAMAGEINGMLAIHCSRSLIEVISSTLTDTENDNFMIDAWAEVANMIAGAFKRHISNTIEVFDISVPTVIMGSEMDIVNRGAKADFPRLIIPFVADDEHTFLVDMLYKRR